MSSPSKWWSPRRGGLSLEKPSKENRTTRKRPQTALCTGIAMDLKQGEDFDNSYSLVTPNFEMGHTSQSEDCWSAFELVLLCRNQCSPESLTWCNRIGLWIPWERESPREPQSKPALKWWTQNHVKNWEGGRSCLWLAFPNRHPPGFWLWLKLNCSGGTPPRTDEQPGMVHWWSAAKALSWASQHGSCASSPRDTLFMGAGSGRKNTPDF